MAAQPVCDKAYYERDAVNNRLWGSSREKAITEQVLRYLPTVAGGVIDIGCGDGFLAYTLCKRHGARFAALDLSSQRLAHVRKQLPMACLIQADARRLPFKDGAFETVICTEVVEHIPEYRQTVQELLRITRRLLIITVPYDQEPVKMTCPHCQQEFYLSGHLHRFSPEMLKELLQPLPGVRDVYLRGFHTIYSYNRLTLQWPALLRQEFDRFLVRCLRLIPFLKPNFLLAVVKKEEVGK